MATGKTGEMLVTEGFMPLKEAVGTMGVSLAWGRQLVSKGGVAHERSILGRIYVHPDGIEQYLAEKAEKAALTTERKEKGFVYVPARIQGLKAFIKYMRGDPGAPEDAVEYAQNVLREHIATWQARRAASAEGETEDAGADAPVAAKAAAPAPAPKLAPKPAPAVADLAAQVKEL